MVQKFIGIVKQQLDYWKYQVANFGPDHPRYRPAKISKYEYLIRDFTELLEYLERQAAQEPVDNSVGFAEPTRPYLQRMLRRTVTAAAPELPVRGSSDLVPYSAAGTAGAAEGACASCAR